MVEGADEEGLNALVEYINRSRGFDLSGYKRTSLSRRIRKRMGDVGCQTYAEYQDRLEVDPDEFESCFNTILINVTGFFRDPPAWEFLADEVVPMIVSSKHVADPVRVWSAGCATGEEAYTLAIVLCEALGAEQFRKRVKIYGTDADEPALVRARQASYSSKDMKGIPTAYVDEYFERLNGEGNFGFRTDLRRSVIFGRHDLVQDAPISRLDLLVCRNTLMYFNTETQARILDRFNFALNDGGFLFLGKAETLLRQSTMFAPVDLRLRIFTKVDRSPNSPANGITARAPDVRPVVDSRLADVAFDATFQPVIVVDVRNIVVRVTAAARSLFGIRSTDIGTPLQNLEVSYRPVELRSLLAEALKERRTVERKAIRWSEKDERRVYDVAASPLLADDGTVIGASVTFYEVTRYHRLQEELLQSNQDLEAAYEELQSTNEELETTNEELQSTVEELETTNEELQSSNEELETTNEELQSTNEELNAMNEQLDHRTRDLDRANGHLQGILTSLRLGVVVLDRGLSVRLWNRWTEDLWGIRADEVEGRNFSNLDIGLPVEQLINGIQRCLDGSSVYEDVTVDARDRRGREIVCRVVCTPLSARDGTDGVILVMESGTAATPGKRAKG